MDSTPPSLQMSYLTLKSLEIYWPNKNYLDDMVLNVKLIELLNFELILIMLQFGRPETRQELYEKITDEWKERHHTELRDL